MPIPSSPVVSQAVLLALFLVTAAAVTSRPWRIPVGWWPLGAVAVALLIGAMPAVTAAHGLGSSLDVVAFFAGLLLLAWALRVTGSLGQLLDRLEGWSRGEPRRLLVMVAVATVAVTALLSNDAAALLLAPEIFDRLERRRLCLTPFVLTMAFTANAASALLPISNPVNLLILDRSDIALSTYLTAVTPAAVVGVLITVGGCLLLTGRGPFPGSLASAVSPLPPALDRPRTVGVTWLLGLLVVIDVGFAAARLPLGPPTLAAGTLSVALVWTAGGSREIPRGLGWSILALVAGFSVLASGLAHSGWLASVSGQLARGGLSWSAGFFIGAVTAVISGLINNLPAALLVTAGLQAAHHVGSLALAAIVGADLGPNLAPFGSISTILILAAARRRDQPVPWSRVWQLGLIVGPLALLPTLSLVALAR
ncbi:MAG TPA: SLC13 family permease [Candidatus Dormibacteraeota bacterium]|nr:SLC13 family permease [Candidatus Dormibacteraeota bacterium]